METNDITIRRGVGANELTTLQALELLDELMTYYMVVEESPPTEGYEGAYSIELKRLDYGDTIAITNILNKYHALT